MGFKVYGSGVRVQRAWGKESGFGVLGTHEDIGIYRDARGYLMICEGFPKLGVPRGVPKIGITVFWDL